MVAWMRWAARGARGTMARAMRAAPRSPSFRPLPLAFAFAGSLACAVLLGESTSGELAGAACPEWGRGSAFGAKYGASAEVDAQIGAFVQAAYDLSAVVRTARGQVVASCRAMGRDLRADPAALQAEDPRRVCGAVSARIDEILRGGVKVQVRAVPPRCTVDANFEASCQGQCSARLEPAQIVARCEPGKLAGTCRGTCTGRCEGTCSGACSGACSATDASGRCRGACEGACNGTCSGTCHADCQGTWEAPRCEGKLKGPSAEADCYAACKARADARARCTPGKVDVRASGAAEARRVADTLRRYLPALIMAQVRLAGQIRQDLVVLKETGALLRGQIRGAGSHAAACVAAAANAVAEATVTVSITVEASASVSGKVGAGR